MDTRTLVRSWVDPMGDEHTAAGILRGMGLRHPEETPRLAPWVQRAQAGKLPNSDRTGSIHSGGGR